MSKKLILTLFAILALALTTQAQSPNAFNYQALVRDAAGQVLPETRVSFRIHLSDPASSAAPAYTEIHQATTDAFGRVDLQIGQGKPVNGLFSELDWAGAQYTIQVELDVRGGSDFTALGASQLLSVPYALHARTVENDRVEDSDADPKNELQRLELLGDTLQISDGNYVVLPAAMTGNPEDVQTLSLSSATLSISGGNSVNLSNLKDTDFKLSRVNKSGTKKLIIEGSRTGSASNGNFAEIAFKNSDENGGNIRYVGAMIGSANTYGGSDGDLRFYTYNGSLTQRMIIDNIGWFQFGTDNPSYPFDVVQERNGNFIARFRNTANSNGSRDDGILIQAGHNTYYSSQQSAFLQFETPDGGYCGRIKQASGHSVNYYDASDRRLKENITDTRYGLQDLLKIRVRDYNYIADGPDQPRTGFIAQELYEVYPTAVDKGGEDVKTAPWGVAYGKLTPILVQALQDQEALIEAQKALNEKQRERLEVQEAQLITLRKAASLAEKLEARLKTLETAATGSTALSSK